MNDIQQDIVPLNLTVPFTEDERRRFTVYCALQGRKKGAFVRLLTMGVVDGKLDISPLLGQ